jgi:hypothetical protein
MATELQVGSISFSNTPYCLDCLQPINNHLPGCKLKTVNKLQDTVDISLDQLFKNVEEQTTLLRMWMKKYQNLLQENQSLLERLEKYEKQ